MDNIFKQIERTANNYGLQTWAAVATLIGFIVLIFDRSGLSPLGSISYFFIVIFVLFLSVSLIIGIYIVHKENASLKRCADEIHQINHEYRNSLSDLFYVDKLPMTGNTTDDKEMLLIEKRTLTIICRKISNIFELLIRKKCMVTVKLMSEEEGRKYCFGWARSESGTVRDRYGEELFEINSRLNNGFTEALKFAHTRPCNFFSEDLLKLDKEGKYHNGRKGWKDLYKSTIVVPIGRIIDLNDEKNDYIGFLCVDTTSKKRLNNTYHLDYMAAFADQMYNYLSIMRKKYLIIDNMRHEEDENIEPKE